MRWSRYHLYTTREAPNDAEVVSHQLMVRSGMIRKVAAGIYNYLPLGWRTMAKMMAIVRREMDVAGAIELSMPAVQPSELWKESGRWQRYGKELLRITDRHDREFCFGPTHEEVVTDIVRHEVSSYRQLPVNLYQIQTKFRDEIRPRFGLMRGREFMMKDAYSFHATQESLDEEYQSMHDTYCRIFAALGLDYSVVEADVGSIGGSASHEFMVLAETGESAVARCPHCGYGANVEKASTRPFAVTEEEEEKLEEVETPGQSSVEAVAEFLGVPAAKVVKTLLYDSDQGLVAVLVRGDREVNEAKLASHLGAAYLELANEDRVSEATGAPVGFAGPVGLAGRGIRILADQSVRGMRNFVVGANRADAHLKGVNPGRDVSLEDFADLLLVAAGDPCPRCEEGTLEIYRGIEVGHIFQLGTKYSEPMGCTFLDQNGASQAMIMGCYGLGIGRTVAAAIEQNHDEHGIIWPLPLAPFSVLLIALNPDDEAVRGTAEKLYQELLDSGVEVLFDDRDERPGVKFKDADLIGIPIRVVVGSKSLAGGQIELSLRRDRERRMVAVDDALSEVQALLSEGA